MTASKRLPLTVIGGFLGAGKTTLLNHWLQQADGKRIAVLINDFGALNIDAAQVAASGADAIELTNGCVCCSIGDDLTSALMRVIEAARPFDAVVIEASGVSDPWRIAQVGLADPALALDAVIVLVDMDALPQQAADPLLLDSLQRQIRSADLLLLNKIDLVSGDQRKAVHEWLDLFVPKVPRFETRDAVLPAVMREGLDFKRVRADWTSGINHYAAPASNGHDHDHSMAFESWLSRPDQPLAAQALRTALRDMPKGVLRLKGFVQTRDLRDNSVRWCEVQFAGRRGSVRPIDVPPVDLPVLVAIGVQGQLPSEALDAWIERARVPATESS